MESATRKFCKSLVRKIVHKKQTKTKTCEALGFCQSKIEDDEDLNALDMEFVGDDTLDAQTCDTCVKLVELMKGDQLEVGSRKESEQYEL
jgi:hypothetical protein